MITKFFIENKVFMVLIAPLLLGCLSTLSFQPFNITIINFINLPAIFLILTYVSKKSKNSYRKKPYLSNLFYVGYFFGVGYFLTGTYWISNSLTFDKELSYLIPFAIILIPLFLGLFSGFATLAVGPVIKNNFSSVLIFCSAFAFADYLRGKILTGFPWNLTAYSWSWFPEVLQLLNITGLYGFNLLSLTVFCLPLLLIFKKSRNNLIIFFIIIFIFFSNYIYGSLIINQYQNKVTKNKTINFKIISPNLDLKYNLSNDDANQVLRKLVNYSEPQKETKTIFVWPEGSFTGYSFDQLKEFKYIFAENFSEKHIIIFGINTKDKNSERYFNSLLAVNNKFEIIYKYNKNKLVPFGEFLPFQTYLQKFGLKKVTKGYSSFLKSTSQNIFQVGELKILSLICYEIIFPELIQKLNEDVNVIINISEDAWFGGSIGPYQHFSKAIFRAIESNTYLARSANKGISAFISSKGQIIKSLKPNEAGTIEYDVPLENNPSKNKNDLIFFILLFTYTTIFFTLKKNND